MAQSKPLIRMIVKGWNNAGTLQLGDCPFCHRALLMAGLKQIPVNIELIDLKSKPEWFLKLAASDKATTPVMVVEGAGAGESGAEPLVLRDSGDIVAWFQTSNPLPAVPGSTDDISKIGASVLPAFGKVIRNKDAAQEEALIQSLYEELAAIDAALGAGPFAGGLLTMGEHDCSLAPKLHHIFVAGPALKGLAGEDRYPSIARYLQVRHRAS